MIKGRYVVKDDDWNGHPDVAYFQGRLYVVYRSADHHRPRGWTAVKICRSDFFDRNQPKFGKTITLAHSREWRYNCPRISVIDDMLTVICDKVKLTSPAEFLNAENDPANTENVIWVSHDGKDWSDPTVTNIRGILPDRITQMPDSKRLITTTHHVPPGKPHGFVQKWWQAELDGDWESGVLAHYDKDEHGAPVIDPCETSISVIDGQLTAFIRNYIGKGSAICYSHSSDGKKWSYPYETRLHGGHRPTLGQLKSGKILVTYREQCADHARGHWAKNIFAALMDSKDYGKLIILPLDHDSSPFSDGGYTGWVQLPDDQVFVVNYMVGRDRKPNIKWYIIKEDDF